MSARMDACRYAYHQQQDVCKMLYVQLGRLHFVHGFMNWLQGAGVCRGACAQLFDGRCCYQCHDPPGTPSFAVDLGNAQ